MRVLVYCESSAGTARSMRMLRPRQALPAAFVNSIMPNPGSTATPNTHSWSPDGLKGCFASAAAGGIFTFTVTSTSAATATNTLGAAFSGTAYAAACSNTYYAFGGSSSSFLMVFNISTGALETINTTGLGTVYSLAFSPDGNYLAVVHNASPYLRIYTTGTWTSVNAGTALTGAPTSNNSSVCFNRDGTKVIASAGSSPGLSTYTTSTGVRTGVVTTTSAVSTIVKLVAHPTQDKVFYCGTSGTTANQRLGVLDYLTNTTSVLGPAPTTMTAGVVDIAYDALEDRLWLVHAPFNGTCLSYISVAAAPTVIVPDMGDFANAVDSANANGVSLSLISNGHGVLTGTVRDVSNAPVARDVYAIERSSMTVVAKTTSDASTGNYTLLLPNTTEHDIVFQAASGELLNDLFYARTIPSAS